MIISNDSSYSLYILNAYLDSVILYNRVVLFYVLGINHTKLFCADLICDFVSVVKIDQTTNMNGCSRLYIFWPCL